MTIEHKQSNNTDHEKTILKQLMRTIPALVNGQNLSDVLETILRAVQASGFDRVRLYLLSEDKYFLQGYAQVGIDRDFTGFRMPVEDSHAKKLLADHQPHLFCSETEHPVPFAAELEKEGVPEWADIPLIVNGEMIGQISVDNKFTKKKIVSSQLEPVALFASQAAAAIEKARLQAKEKDAIRIAERRARQLEVLNQINKHINSALNLEGVLQATLENGLGAIGVDEGSITLVDLKTRALAIKAWKVQEQFMSGEQYKELVFDKGISQHVATTGEAYNCPNVDNDLYWCDSSVRRKPKSVLSVPIISSGRVFGTINADSQKENFFNSDDIQFLRTLAEQVAIALESQRLRYIGTELSTLPLKEMLNKIVESAATWIGVEESAIYLASEKPGESVTPGTRMRAVKFPFDRTGGFYTRKDGITSHVIRTGETIIINDVQRDSRPRVSAQKRGIKSMMAAPLKTRDREGKVKSIGALSIDSYKKRTFSHRDQELLESLAGQAAVAIAVTAQHERVNRAQKAATVVAEITTLGNLENTLQSVVQGTMEVAGGDAVTLFVYNQDEDMLVHPPTMIGVNDEEQASCLPAVEKNSIVYKMLECRQSYIVEDIDQDTLFKNTRFAKDEQIKSCVAIPLRSNAEKVGVMFVNYRNPHPFSQDELTNIELFANQAAIAIRNSQQYRELEKTRDALAVHTAIAWLGAARNTWDHKTAGHIAAVEQYVKLLEGDIDLGCSDEKLKERLSKIKLVIEKTRERKITARLSPDEGIEVVDVDEFIRQWIEKVYWDADLLAEIPYELKLNSRASIRVNPAWFKLAVDDIVNNALRAMKSVFTKKLTVKTAMLNNMVEIVIADTGPGIPQDIQSKYGMSMIKKEQGALGEGIGAMLSNMIIQTYEGEMGILETDLSGTSIFVRLPCEQY